MTMRKFICICTLLILNILTAAAYADMPVMPPVAYNTWIGHVQVMESNRDNLASALGFQSGAISYIPARDGEPAQLNLSDVTLKAVFTQRFDTSPSPSSYHWWSYATIYSEEDLVINVIGKNQIDTTGFRTKGANLMGIYSTGNITVKGNGSLHISTGDATNNNSLDYRDSIALYAAKSLTIKEGVTISAKGGVSERNSAGLRGRTGIRIEDRAEVVAFGGTAPYSFGCWEGPVEISGGILITEGQTRAIEGNLIFNVNDGMTMDMTAFTEFQDIESEKSEKEGGSYGEIFGRGILAPGKYSEKISKFKSIYITFSKAEVSEHVPASNTTSDDESAASNSLNIVPHKGDVHEANIGAVKAVKYDNEKFVDMFYGSPSLEEIEAAINNGADVNWVNSTGNTALILAVSRSDPKPDIAVINALLKAGANQIYGTSTAIRH